MKLLIVSFSGRKQRRQNPVHDSETSDVVCLSRQPVNIDGLVAGSVQTTNIVQTQPPGITRDRIAGCDTSAPHNEIFVVCPKKSTLPTKQMIDRVTTSSLAGSQCRNPYYEPRASHNFKKGTRLNSPTIPTNENISETGVVSKVENKVPARPAVGRRVSNTPNASRAANSGEVPPNLPSFSHNEGSENRENPPQARSTVATSHGPRFVETTNAGMKPTDHKRAGIARTGNSVQTRQPVRYVIKKRFETSVSMNDADVYVPARPPRSHNDKQIKSRVAETENRFEPVPPTGRQCRTRYGYRDPPNRKFANQDWSRISDEITSADESIQEVQKEEVGTEPSTPAVPSEYMPMDQATRSKPRNPPVYLRLKRRRKIQRQTSNNVNWVYNTRPWLETWKQCMWTAWHVLIRQ